MVHNVYYIIKIDYDTNKSWVCVAVMTCTYEDPLLRDSTFQIELC